MTRANLAAVIDEAQQRGSGAMDIDAVLADPASYADRLFLALQLQKQIVEPAAASPKCVTLVPGVMSASEAVGRGILVLSKNDAGGLTAALRFYVADDADGARLDAATGNIIVGDGEENRQIKDPLWATYKAASSSSEGGADGGGGCSAGIPALLLIAALPAAAVCMKRRKR